MRRLGNQYGSGQIKVQTFNRMLKEYGIHHIVTYNEVKANYAERVIKTIKSKMFRYFTHKQTFRYIDILQSTAESYNETYHDSLGCTPSSVTKENEGEVRLDQYMLKNRTKKKWKKKRPYLFKTGDLVRITHLRTPFTREYDETWTGEVFKVASRFRRDGLPIYKLRDYYEKEDIKGTFYQAELQKIDIEPDKMWKIGNIQKTTGKGSRKKHLIRWQHWPKKYDSWVKDSDMEDL